MSNKDFEKRREEGRKHADQLEARVMGDKVKRTEFFSSVYQDAKGDEAAVPWADMAPKRELDEWLETNAPFEGRAIDIGCGLGDNAEALANAGFQTTGFDFSQEAIDWAKQRFPNSSVTYETADLTRLPEDWLHAFALVHECYTLQSIPPQTLEETIPATASLVAPGGVLLVYARVREDGEHADGPPWPLEISKAMSFTDYGLELVSQKDFSLDRGERKIPHVFCVWRRPA